MKFGLTEKDWLILSKALFDPFRKMDAKVWIFGSRARGDYKKFSDIDILYEFPAAKPPPAGLISQITEELENSNIPYKVDLVERSSVAESYQAQIEKEKVEISL